MINIKQIIGTIYYTSRKGEFVFFFYILKDYNFLFIITINNLLKFYKITFTQHLFLKHSLVLFIHSSIQKSCSLIIYWSHRNIINDNLKFVLFAENPLILMQFWKNLKKYSYAFK